VDGLALHIGHDAQTPCAQLNPDRIAARSKELSMTKIAITSEGPGLADRVDPRFGRAGGFVVVDVDTMETTYVDNGSSQSLAHGAGIQAAENIINAGASVLLTGMVGPKAFAALKAGGVKIGHNQDGKTVGEAVEAFKAGNVEYSDSPDK
jgi:predicted Fe-Mo cluster-binding NifX family protein